MIAFAMLDADEQTSDIWVVSSDGTELARVTDCIGRFTGTVEARSDAKITIPRGRPTERRIVFTRNYSLYTVRVDGSGSALLETTSRGHRIPLGPRTGPGSRSQDVPRGATACTS